MSLTIQEASAEALQEIAGLDLASSAHRAGLCMAGGRLRIPFLARFMKSGRSHAPHRPAGRPQPPWVWLCVSM